MFRHSLVSIMLAVLPCFISTAHAQRLIVVPGADSGEVEEVHFIANLPADKVEEVRAVCKCVPRVGFLYRCHYFLFTYRHSHGRFVLYDQDHYWEVSREGFDLLLGPQAAASLLVIPGWYGYPVGLFIWLILGGLVALGILFVVVAMLFHMGRDHRVNKLRELSEDERYVAALSKYLEHMPASGAASNEQHKQGLLQGMEYLVEHGISPRRAKSQLKGFLKLTAQDRVDDLKTQADQLTEEKRWEEAEKLYQEAEAVAHHLAPDQARLIRHCLAWCAKERVEAL
ncbi:MAG TPA: hypothetical protein PLN21_14805 [Gemmatales bacterium]|nr:hypothetical protein [Gemmatales bacterium]